MKAIYQIAHLARARGQRVDSRPLKIGANSPRQNRRSASVPRALLALCALVLLAFSLTLTGCGRSPEKARLELAALNRQFSPHDFVESAHDGDKLAVELSLESGMDVDAANDSGVTAIQAAVAKHHSAIVEVLISEKPKNLAEALRIAASAQDLPTVKLLVENGADVNIGGTIKPGIEGARWSLLGNAVMSGNEPLVKYLLDKGASVKGQVYAADGGNIDIVYLAVVLNKPGIVSALIKHDADVNAGSTGHTPLHYARKKGLKQIVDILVAANAKDLGPPD